MIDFIKEQLAIWRFKKSLREFTKPDRTFLKSARMRFVNLAQVRVSVGIRATHSRVWKYATIAIVAVISMTSGMAVFADANNVPATHPLYNFKRVSEQVRLGLSSPAQQVGLHQVFAQRRLEEVAELEMDHDDHPIPPQSQAQIDGLNKDFQNETSTVLDGTPGPNIQPQDRVKFCHDIMEVIKNRPQPNLPPPPMIDHIKIRCGEVSEGQKN